ncbi:MAG: hypothetical protein J0L92_01735 [Deltaproteobacteria bacterium]|nr:hypothetical protein [Deltaproteobacteria bacterium]
MRLASNVVRCVTSTMALALLAGCPPSEPPSDARTLDAFAIVDADAPTLDVAPEAATDAAVPLDACPAPTRLCGSVCVDVEADPDHCGACGQRCVPLAGSIPFCASYLCVRAVCRPGFANCDTDRLNGCEVDVDASIEHCGRCDHACEGAPHASPVCRRGDCALTCESGWTDCDTSIAGCECEL